MPLVVLTQAGEIAWEALATGTKATLPEDTRGHSGKARSPPQNPVCLWRGGAERTGQRLIVRSPNKCVIIEWDANMPQQIIHGLNKIAIVLRQEAWAMSSAEGLTPTQVQILSLLYARGEEGMGVKEVAAHLAVTPATASDAVRALDDKGYVRKKPSATDRRAVVLQLSSRGRKLARRTAQWPDFLLAAASVLDSGEQAVLHVALVKMVRSLQEQGRIPLARMCSNCTYFHPNEYPHSGRPHFCGYIEAPIGAVDLRLDCADFQEAPGEQRASTWNKFVHIETAAAHRE